MSTEQSEKDPLLKSDSEKVDDGADEDVDENKDFEPKHVFRRNSSVSINEDDEIFERRIEVHVVKKIVMVVGAWFFVVTVAFMTVAGYQNFKEILIDENVYRWLCPPNYNLTEPCKPQIFRYGLMLSVSGTLLNALVIIIGPMNDLLGPKFIGVLGVVVDLIGTLILSFSSEKFDGYVVGYVLMTVGGCFIFVTFIHLNNMLLDQRLQFFFNSGVMSSQDTGAVMFLIAQLICEHTGVKLSYLLWGYTGILLLAGLYIILLQPWQTYPMGMKKIIRVNEGRCKKIKRYMLDYLKNVWKAIKSIKIWAFMMYAITGTTVSYFYFQTFREQMTWLSNGNNPKKVDLLVYVLGILLLFVGILSSFLMATMMSVFGGKRVEGKPFKNFMRYLTLPSAFMFVAILVLIQMVCSVIPVLDLQYVTMIAFISIRACYFSLFTQFAITFFSDIAMSVIGVLTFGGGMATLSNYGWQIIALDNYFWYNIVFGTVFVLQSVFMAVASMVWLYLKENKENKEIKIDEKKRLLPK